MAKKKDKKKIDTVVKVEKVSKLDKGDQLDELEARLMARIQQLSADLLGGPTPLTGDVEVTVAGERVAAVSEQDLSTLDVEVAAGNMGALAHPVRLTMCLATMNGPVRVTQLMEQLGLNTTGQAYHHLRILLKEGWLEGDGDYRLAPGRLPILQGMVALSMAGRSQ